MIDLHLHLDGALSPDLVVELAKIEKIEIPIGNALREKLQAPKNCESLNQYLECFEIPVAVMQSSKSLEYAAYTVASELKKQGLRGAEIRFAPQLHTRKGLSQREVIHAVLQGLKAVDFSSGLILCCMRGADETVNLQTVREADYFLGNGVCALDLAGAEGLYPTHLYRKLFQVAKEAEIPFTIHAGEAAGAESIWEAVQMGVKRIGHGIHACEDATLVSYLAEHKIPLELCPSSNFQTKASDIEHYPLKYFLEQGIIVTINTDNPTVSQTTLKQEYQWLRTYGCTEEQIETIRKNAYHATFLNNL